MNKIRKNGSYAKTTKNEYKMNNVGLKIEIGLLDKRWIPRCVDFCYSIRLRLNYI